MIRTVTLLALLLVVACDGPGSAAPPSSSHSQDPPTVLAAVPRPSEIPPSATTARAASEPPTPERPPPVRVAPRTLAVSWQSYLGRRVSLRCRPVRRIDFVRTLVVAGAERFVVTGSPNATPCGPATSTFVVMGSSSVAISGRTVLPELLLEDVGGEELPR